MISHYQAATTRIQTEESGDDKSFLAETCSPIRTQSNLGTVIPALSSLIINTGRFIMFSVITHIYNKKTEGPTLMEMFTATGKLKKKKFFFDN